jgi:hypothetical protein
MVMSLAGTCHALAAGPRSGGGHAQRVPQVGDGGGAPRGVDAQFPGQFAHDPFGHLDLGGLVLTFAVQRMKGQAGDQHGDVAVNAVGPGLFQAHAVEGHIEFFGHQHGQRGVDALTHLAARHGQHHSTVFGDLDPAVQRHIAFGFEHQIGRAQARAGRHHAPAHHQGTGRAQGAQDPGTAFHAAPPFFMAAAARWMAARTRW